MKSTTTMLATTSTLNAPKFRPALLSAQQLELVHGGGPAAEIAQLARESSYFGATLGSVAGYAIRGTVIGATRGGLAGSALGFAAGAGFGVGTVIYNYFSGGGRRYRSKPNIV